MHTAASADGPIAWLSADLRGLSGHPCKVLRGVTVRDIDAAARRQFRLPASLHGALVAEVEVASAAFASGLRRGEVIQEINRQPVRNAPDAMHATRNLLSPRALVRVWSRAGSRCVVVDETQCKGEAR